MSRISRTLVAVTALAALGALTAADAQKPTPPTPPKPPVVKPVTGIKAPSAPAAGGITIICKDFGFGQMPGALPYRDSRITYETVTVKDMSGVARTIYAPTRIIVSQEFKPATARTDSDGRGLVAGECGTPNAVNFVFASAPSADFLEQRLCANQLGDITAIEMRLFFKRWPRDWQASAAWLARREQGGFVREVLSHFII